MDERVPDWPQQPTVEVRMPNPRSLPRTNPGTWPGLDESHTARFSEFYRDNIKPLVRFLAWKGVPVADAAEAAQDAMIDAARQWQTIRRPRAWVWRVASRKAIERISAVEETPLENVTEVTSLLRVPHDRAVQWAEEQRVLHLLRRLPGRQRQVMAWTFDGYKPSEIAKLLDMAPDAVRSTLLKARRALAAYLAEADVDEQ